MSIFEIRTMLGTTEFTLVHDLGDEDYTLDTVAYGEWDRKVFTDVNQLKHYLKEEYKMDKVQVHKLMACMETINTKELVPGTYEGSIKSKYSME